MTAAEATGLLLDGRRLEIPGLTILGPGDAPWIRLDGRDYRKRPPGTWIRQLIVHTTWGGWPHALVPGAGPRGGAKSTAMYWHTYPGGREQSGGAHLVVDEDGSVACLADIARAMAFHATVCNPWSVGVEMYQRPGGAIREGTLDATVRLVVALCELLAIPFQVPSRAYPGAPIARMVRGGPDMAGVFGHRDLTHDRGRGDPGDEIFARLRAAGAEALDFDARADLEVWRRRQARLGVPADGAAGPRTIEAMRALGFRSGREIDAV